MAELRENSILFSLNGLFQREHERVTEEAEQERQRVEAEQLERLERERRSLELQELERREREQHARREEQRCREEGARIEALRAAEVARACAEAEAKARIELDAQHRQHELRLESIREQGGRRRAQQLAVGCAIVALASWVAGAWLYLGQLAPDGERRGQNERLFREERARSQELERLVQGAERRNAELTTELKKAMERIRELAGAAGSTGGPGTVPGAAGSGGPRKGMAPAAPRLPASGGAGTPREDRGATSPRKKGRPCPDNRDPLDNCL